MNENYHVNHYRPMFFFITESIGWNECPGGGNIGLCCCCWGCGGDCTFLELFIRFFSNSSTVVILRGVGLVLLMGSGVELSEFVMFALELSV